MSTFEPDALVRVVKENVTFNDYTGFDGREGIVQADQIDGRTAVLFPGESEPWYFDDDELKAVLPTLTWQDLNFRDEVVLPSGTRATVVGLRACVGHASGDAQLRLAYAADDKDPLWYPVASLRRAVAEVTS